MGHLNIVLLLLQNGASPDVTNIVSMAGSAAAGLRERESACARVRGACASVRPRAVGRPPPRVRWVRAPPVRERTGCETCSPHLRAAAGAGRTRSGALGAPGPADCLVPSPSRPMGTGDRPALGAFSRYQIRALSPRGVVQGRPGRECRFCFGFVGHRGHHRSSARYPEWDAGLQTLSLCP